MRAILALMLLLPLPALAQARRIEPQPSIETIGSWQLGCITDPMTDQGSCTLRHRLWLEEPVGGDAPRPGVGLEVLLRGGFAVPAVVARDLTLDSARLALLGVLGDAQLRFGREPATTLPCALEGWSLVCAPRADQRAAAAGQLAAAASVLVRLPQNPITGAGGEPLALDLSQTGAAIQRLRARMPEPPAPEPPPAEAAGGQLERLLDQLRRAVQPRQ